VLYLMYRGLYRSPEDLSVMMGNHLRYDITVIPPGNLGKEHVKTAGHHHRLVSGTDLSYTEVYEVLEGTAHYLMQAEVNNRLTDVFWVECESGDKIIIPPGYGHVTINPSPSQTLKMANWVSRDFSSEYARFKALGGASYFELATGMWEVNEKYGRPPKLKKIKPTNYSEWGLKRKDMYSLIGDPDKLAYLNRPQDYRELFRRVLKDSA
ncbi:MAG: glucose-6-phosphate isomerase family protein, partial [Candidatus Altiarchaeota archaeon]